MLASKDGMIRQKARNSLVKLGKPAVPSLIKALQNSESVQLRRVFGWSVKQVTHFLPTIKPYGSLGGFLL